MDINSIEQKLQALQQSENSEFSSEYGKILLVDSMNLCIRSFAALSLSHPDSGEHNGMTLGTLQSLRAITETFRPTKIVFCWEGKNSSKKRREVLSEYKENRKVRKSLNRTFQWENLEQEQDSFRKQLYRVKEYLETLPVYQVEVDFMEADDVIAYVCNYLWLDKEKIIVSSDKDYFQLITDKVSVFRPVKRELIHKATMLEDYKIFPSNWIIIKTLTGDNSDGVPSICRGLGIKTINKLFPFLLEEKKFTVSDILDHCQKNVNEHRFYKAVLENKNNVEKNWQVMQLLEHNFSVDGVQTVKDALKQKPEFKPFQLRLLMMQDVINKQIQQFDSWNRLFVPLNWREENS